MLGAAIMIISLVLFEDEFLNIVAISFTSLILNELIMVALEVTIWYVLFFKAKFSRLTYLLQAYLYGNFGNYHPSHLCHQHGLPP